MRRHQLWLYAVWLAAATATVVSAVRPDALTMHRASSGPVVETAIACAALVLAALFFGRWQQRRMLPDLVTSFALGLLAAGKLVFTVIPLAIGSITFARHERASAFICGVVAAIALAVGTLMGEGHVRRRSSRWEFALFSGAIAVATAAVALTATPAASGLSLAGPPSTDASGDSGASTITVLHLVCALAFGVASMRFVQRQRLTGDGFYGWLAMTTLLWSVARINYALAPHRIGDELTLGDWMRMAGFIVGAVAATYEFTGYWRRLADAAVLEERRRMAREMHDGLAQELAFIATQSRGLRRVDSSATVEALAKAAERALDESRRGIAALTRPPDEPLDVALAQQAEELSGRLGVRVTLDLEPVGVPLRTREALLRIAREAITNAGRHGKPTRIAVELCNHSGVRLRICDDGRGFRVDDPRVFAGGRYGITGMRERAEALGGELWLTSQPFVGTEVEVRVP